MTFSACGIVPRGAMEISAARTPAMMLMATFNILYGHKTMSNAVSGIEPAGAMGLSAARPSTGTLIWKVS